MNWNRIRLCDDCGAGNPADATACISCGSSKLGAPKGPPKTPPPPDRVDLRQASYEDESCGECGSHDVTYGIIVPTTIPDRCTLAVVPAIRCAACDGAFPRPSVKAEATERVRTARTVLSVRWTQDWIFLPRSAVIRDSIASDSPVPSEGTGIPTEHSMQTVPLVSHREIAELGGGTCLRMHFAPSLDRKSLVATLFVGSEGAWIEVTPIVGGGPLPEAWMQCVGRRDVTNGNQILQRLEKLGVWDLPRCDTLVFDGVSYFHYATSADREHSITMHNPSHHEDRRYTDIVNVYSEMFLDAKAFHESYEYPRYAEMERKAMEQVARDTRRRERPWWKFW